MMYSLLESAAKSATSLLHGKPENWYGIATQFVLEKGWGWWEAPFSPYDVGNLMSVMGQGHPLAFSTLEDGITAYVDFLTVDDVAGYYTKVINAIRTGTVEDFLVALSESKYCDPPYSLDTLNNVRDLVKVRFPIPQVNLHWQIISGWFSSRTQCVQAVVNIKKETGYHAWVSPFNGHWTVTVGWFGDKIQAQNAVKIIEERVKYNSWVVLS